MSLERRGRPRSEASRQAVLRATHDLIIESGYDRLTMSAIAARAGVGKQTVYRWWPDKPTIVAECVLETLAAVDLIAAAGIGEVGVELYSWLTASCTTLGTPQGAQLLRALIGAAIEDPAISHRLTERLAELVRGSLDGLLAGGIADGQIHRDESLEAASDALIGALIVAIIGRRAYSETRANELASLVLRGLREHGTDGQ